MLLRDALRQQQIGGAGEQKTPGDPLEIDRALHRVQKLGRALNLVESDRIDAADERLRIALSGIEDIEIVQGAVGPVPRHEALDQGALPGLARAGDDDRRHDTQVLDEARGGQTR